MSIHSKPIIAQQPGINGCDDDDTIANAHADDGMRAALWEVWPKQGPNPDDMPSKDLGAAYRDMVLRQRNTAPKER